LEFLIWNLVFFLKEKNNDKSFIYVSKLFFILFKSKKYDKFTKTERSQDLLEKSARKKQEKSRARGDM
jgi:hypothetical protein